ncbi:hypothetical protein Tco_0268790 [Tanacetum coccineum]
MFETPSPPPPPTPPPPPQPPLMGHPIFFNVLDYHGAHCLFTIARSLGALNEEEYTSRGALASSILFSSLLDD